VEIEGTNALVVGGASGLGEATARRLHEAGARVVIADLNAARRSSPSSASAPRS
jgi:NAD(P)-dependent dehydrogenase (short-subunit alcohol dehydrogenase family)